MAYTRLFSNPLALHREPTSGRGTHRIAEWRGSNPLALHREPTSGRGAHRIAEWRGMRLGTAYWYTRKDTGVRKLIRGFTPTSASFNPLAK